jgi:hypothetical protein
MIFYQLSVAENQQKPLRSFYAALQLDFWLRISVEESDHEESDCLSAYSAMSVNETGMRNLWQHHICGLGEGGHICPQK